MMQSNDRHYKTAEHSAVFSCDGCEYNHDGIGCGGHCLKNLMLSTQGGNLYRMKLVIAEKPSQGMAFAKVLGAVNKKNGFMEGNGWIVSWCYGHMLRLSQPDEIDPELRKWRMEDLPILPRKWTYIPDENKKPQLERLVTLMNDPAVTSIVCATDAGREGELIFRLLYDYAGCVKPVERLWINSMEDDAIRAGFQNLRSAADFDRLYQAALCRSRADWLIGINATRRYGALTHRKGIRIGRVQSPTLAMLVQRQEEIKAFQPTAYYTVELSGNGLKTVSEPIEDKQTADALVSACNGQAVVRRGERSRKTVKPPMLYDLTALQRDANRIYGYSALTTSDLAQQLYERKLLTYPRTDSRYITEDMRDSVAELVKTACSALNVASDFKPDTVRIADGSKVSDHYALLPTANVGRAALSELDEESGNLLRLVLLRLVSAVSKPCVYEETAVTLDCGGALFTAKGRMVIEPGWKACEGKDGEVSTLPSLTEGDTISVRAKRRDHQTKPPLPYTEDTLLAAMESAASSDFEGGVERSGLGTPATRASIIDKLIVYDYVKRMGRNLIPTERAKLLIGMLPEELRSPALTAQWENELLRMERGEANPAQFMEGIEALTRKIVALEPDVDAVRQLTYFGVDEVGKCPRCGKPVYEQPNGFFCSDRSCRFALWRNSGYLAKAGIKLTRSLAAELIANGQAHVEDVKFEDSSEGDLILVELGGKYPSFKYKATDRAKS